MKTKERTTKKNIIVAGIKSGHAPGKKPLKKMYSFSGAKQKTANDALKIMGALNTLNHLLTAINGYARRVVFDNILSEWLADVLAGKEEIEAFTVTTGDAKALIVPMKKYAIIDEDRANKIFDLDKKYHIDVEMDEVRHFSLNPHLVELLPDDKMNTITEELEKALLKSATVPEKVKKDIRSGKLSVFDETTRYAYTQDILTNIAELSKGDVKKAKAIIDAVQPVFAVRSFEMQDREVEVAEALDLIKENMNALPDAAELTKAHSREE